MIKIFGHRGAAGYALENTFESFQKAIEMNVDFIETDIQQTLDGNLLVFHDNTLDRLTNGSGFIEEKTYQEVSQLRYLKDGSKIITLKEYCEFCKENNIKSFIEVKGENIASSVLKVLLEIFNTEDFILGSFFHKQIVEAKKENPKVQTCILFEGYFDQLYEYIIYTNADFISVGFESVSLGLVNDVKKANKNLIFWTINDEIDAIKAFKYNPYGIVSNYPDKIKKLYMQQSLPKNAS